jgi:hypothetical protein
MMKLDFFCNEFEADLHEELQDLLLPKTICLRFA